ncbi:MAG: YggS family pyridoxal phosphate-dependent enzyme [Nannocystaceae bacterium]
MILGSTIADNLARVREAIEAAIARRGAGPTVTLIGVSKRQPIAAIEAARAAGLADFGENYAQELRDKVTAIGRAPPTWHFIGGLQSNKVKLVCGQAMIHTVDRPSLVDALEARAARDGVIQELLLEVNLAGEAQKAGAAPEALPALLDRIAAASALRCRGLMIIPPVDEPEESRRWFVRLRELRDRLAGDARPNVELHHLSMGMSADFAVAIEEGATLVRVGTAIFGPRPG